MRLKTRTKERSEEERKEGKRRTKPNKATKKPSN